MTKKSKKASWSDGLGSFVVAVLIAMTIRWLFLEAYVIPSGSMLPSLLIHDHIFVNKMVYGIRIPFGKTWLVRFTSPKSGDVIVFKYPEDESIFFIKRVVGIPGDKIAYENGNLFVNDKQIEKLPPQNAQTLDAVRDFELPGGKDQYVHFNETLGASRFDVILKRGENHYGVRSITVPENQLFVMGDNRDNSHDSRYWGFVPQENILGRASFVWLSCEETLPFLTFLCNPTTVRWNRFFHVVE